jgi:16S rRNA (adenine1518-N6/adenine1519-N6)-dimethyltransferase
VTQARKRFGQNFLEDVWVRKVLDAIAPEPGQSFIEVGPGRGALTAPLAACAAHVLAFEIDRDLVAGLQATLPGNVTLVQGDFLAVTAERLRALLSAAGASRPSRVAGNLPYNVASPILFKLVELYGARSPLVDATVMLQREVADRLVAGPGSREYGVLSVLIQYSADVERLLNLPPGAFRPSPVVHSALVRLRFHPPAPPARDPAGLAALVQAVFTRRRKTLANALLAYQPAPSKRGRAPSSEVLTLAGLDGSRRPETLSVAEFVRLSDSYPDPA